MRRVLAALDRVAALAVISRGRVTVLHRPREPFDDLQRTELVPEVNRIDTLVQEDDVALIIRRHDDAGSSDDGRALPAVCRNADTVGQGTWPSGAFAMLAKCIENRALHRRAGKEVGGLEMQ